MAQSPQIYLRLESGTLPAPDELEAAIEAARPAAMLLAVSDGAAATEPLRQAALSAKRQNLAVLIEGELSLVRELGADGIHLPPSQRLIAAARVALGEAAVIGATCSLSRHEAMEMAEAGADYVAFGERGEVSDPEALEDMVAWWAELFEIPCVAWLGDEAAAEEAGWLAQAGADFLAVTYRAGSGEAGLERLREVAVVLVKTE